MISVDEARREYEDVAYSVLYHGDICCWPADEGTCPACRILAGYLDAASLRLDLIVAESSHDRIRSLIAYA